MDGAKEVTRVDVASDGGRLFCGYFGDGPPTLLAVHGVGFDHWQLRPHLDSLAASMRVVYFDLRGHGRSARAPAETLDHDAWTRDIEAVRSAAAVGPTFLFGHSYGGFLALEHALRYPGALAGLILCSTAPALDFFEVSLAEARRRAGPDAAERVVRGFGQPLVEDDVFRRVFRELLPLYFHRPDAHDLDALFGGIDYRATMLDHAHAECLPRYDLRDALARVRVPTLIVNGDDDWLMPVAHGARRLHEGIPRSELAVLERSGHFPFIERPRELADLVRRFVCR